MVAHSRPGYSQCKGTPQRETLRLERTMLPQVQTDQRRLDEYQSVVGEKALEEIRSLAKPLQGKRVLHFNATPYGGGVAELLKTLVPLMSDIGMVAEWRVMSAGDDLFSVTKQMHNSLQGEHVPWTKRMWDTWLSYNLTNALEMDNGYDIVVVHDPQPAAVLSFLRRRRPSTKGKWVWRCHIDLTDAQADVWEKLAPYVSIYDAAIFTLPQYVKSGFSGPEVFTFPPAIDPLSTKNRRLNGRSIQERLRGLGLDPSRPIIAQVSRHDPWKDPLGVIDVYRMVKREVPDLQLVLLASMAADDPEGWEYYEKALRHAGEDEDIHFLTDRVGAGNDIPVNTIQTGANVILQKSIREGFGLTVSEALWKGTPVVAGAVGGIPLQIVDGETGHLARNNQECAERVLTLLRDPALAKRMGQAGREHVREQFLVTRYLKDYLMLFNHLLGAGGVSISPGTPTAVAALV
jgi:trehalose synthase